MNTLDKCMEPTLWVGKDYYKRGWLSPSFLRHFLPVFTKWGSLKTTIFVAGGLPDVYLALSSVYTSTSGLKPLLLLERSWPSFLSGNSTPDQSVVFTQQLGPLSQVRYCLRTDLTTGSKRWTLMWEGGEADCSTVSKQCSCEWPGGIQTPTHTVLYKLHLH